MNISVILILPIHVYGRSFSFLMSLFFSSVFQFLLCRSFTSLFRCVQRHAFVLGGSFGGELF